MIMSAKKKSILSSLKSWSALILVLSLTLFGCEKDHEHEEPCNHKTIKVAALLSKTGEWSNLGITSEAALQIGVDERTRSRRFYIKCV